MATQFFKSTGTHLPVYALYKPEHKNKHPYILLTSSRKTRSYVQLIRILKIPLFTEGTELLKKLIFTSIKT